MRRVLYDLNIVLDVLLSREPFFVASAAALDAASRGEVEGYLSAHLVTTLFYLLRRSVGADRARMLTADLLVKLRVAPVTDAVVRRALAMPFRDLEDAVCHASAEEVDASLIVTRNTEDFGPGVVPAVLPEVFVQMVTEKRESTGEG